MAVHLIVVQIFQCILKWWVDQHTGIAMPVGSVAKIVYSMSLDHTESIFV